MHTRNGVVAQMALLFVVSGIGRAAEQRPSVAAAGLEARPLRGALVRMSDGRLLDWWSAGKKGAQHARGRFSADEGRTWTKDRSLFAFSPAEGDCGTGYVSIVDRVGAVHLFGLDYVGTGPAGFNDWENAKSFIYHVMSSDRGIKTGSCASHPLRTGTFAPAVRTSKQIRILQRVKFAPNAVFNW